MGLFKTYLNPINSDILTNINTIFCHYLVGDDSTGTGTRSNPYKTVTKCVSISPSKYILAAGNGIENIILGSTNTVIADQVGITYVNGSISSPAGWANNVYGIVCNNSTANSGIAFINCILKTESTVSSTNNFSFIFIHRAYKSSANNTILDYKNYIQNNSSSDINNILINSVDLYNFVSRSNVAYYPIFKYCLFRKATLWKWNGSTITINWTNNTVGGAAYTTETLLERVYNSLLYYANNTITAGTDRTYAQAILSSITTMFYADVNGQTNKVVDDSIYPIFNTYNGTTPVNYSLKLDANNVALTMSDSQSYVGAYKANLGGFSFGSIVNVKADGTDDATTPPTLLVSDGYNQFSANDASLQNRNRIRTTVVAYPRGRSFAGAGNQLTSGLASRLGFGKNRPMVTSGSGLTVPTESFEFIPYDSVPADNSAAQANDISGKSTFPRFSCSFNGNTQMWYKANGTPLLFNDLATYSITTDLNLAEYGTWAVTSADAEDYNLSLIATANSLTKKNIPVIYGKQELNLNFF